MDSMQKIQLSDYHEVVPSFGGILYIGLRGLPSFAYGLEVVFSVSSLGQEHQLVRLKLGETDVYDVQGIGRFWFRLDKILPSSAWVTIALLDTMPPQFHKTENKEQTTIPNTPFKHNEIQVLELMIENIQSEIIEHYKPDNETQKRIKERFSIVRSDLKKAKRIDWGRMIMTTMLGIAIDLGFSNDMPSFLLAVMKRLLEKVAEVSAVYLLKPNTNIERT